MSYSELEDYLKSNPLLKQILVVPTALNYRGKVKVDNGFRDILKKISKDYPRNNVNIP